MRFYTLFFLFAIGFVGLQAQDECELTLNRALDEFNAGHFYDAPSMLKECLDKNQSAEWRQRAYLLLSETYLLVDDPVGAEGSYLKVLQANPEYVPDEKIDPIDLVYLSSKFTATPIFTLFVKIGPNVSPIHNLRTRETSAYDGKYRLMPGFQLGAGMDWNYDDNVSLTFEGNYVFTGYKYRASGVFGRDMIEMYDRQSWVRLPLSVKYQDDQGKYRPYGYLGYSIDLLVGDRATITLADNNQEEDGIQTKPGESPVYKIQPKRNTFNRSMFVGGGVKYKMGLQYAFIDVRYAFGLTNVVDVDNNIFNYGKGDDKTSAGFQDSGEIAMRWGLVDNFFRMDNLSVTVGYVYPLYKPRKLKKARSKSVFRSIKKQGDDVTSE